jgi:hypothetical protein
MAKNEKAAIKKTSQTAKLQNELIKSIKELNDEGLLFMIQQANVLKYNMQVDMINREKQKLIGNQKSNLKSGVEIIPGEQNRNFIIQLGTARKFLSREDFRSMVLIVQEKDSIKELSSRLFRWMEKERRDILIDCNIRNSSNPLLIELIKQIKSKYKVKK